MDEKTLTSILKEKKLLTDKQAEEVMLAHIQMEKGEEEVILEEKFVSPEEVIKAKSELYGVPFIDLEKVGFSPVSISYVPRSVAERYRLIPFALDEKTGTLSVAMSNPLDLETIDFLERKTELKVKPYMALPQQVEKVISVRYEQELTLQVKEALRETEKKKALPDLDHLDEVIREAPVAKIVSTILQFAMRSQSSDVHIEPQEEDSRVRYRVDGILHEKLLLPKKVHDAVVSRIKVLSDMKIDERRVPQDGRFSFTANNEEVDLRVSSAPTVYGEKIVMRLLKKSGKIPTLAELGMRGKALRDVEEAIARPQGMIIACGPTGSGKTTTLYSVLTKVSTVKVNVMTVEDPVEYQIEGVNQVQVNPQAGLTFASALRSFLRQDPDVVMVGEIRDEETTHLAIHAALTGHLVFSTLHTNDASGAPPRLIDMGAEPFLLVSSLTCVIAQRVLRKICPDCRESFVPDEVAVTDIKNVLGNLYKPLVENQQKKVGQKGVVLWRGKGCKECNNTGYRGRIGIFEVINVDDKVGRLILEKASGFEINKVMIEKGMVTLKQDGYAKVLEGITTVEEVLRVAEF
ncbi:MAG: GspE/PulE family protein [Patescibacteria group bacterium]|nr:GspE/PulE family protein [Patescibacteria group bacterium]